MIDNILIIEDEKAIQSVLYELLTEAGYRVTLANDGLEGLSQFEKQYFSLILLDIMMPKIDGYAVCEIIRKNSDIPIIMLTAMDEEEAQVKALEQTAEALHTEVVQAQVVPRDTGNLQGEGMFVDYSESQNGVVTIVHDVPYARRLYFHPEYHFSKKENPNARGEWFEDWLPSGKNADFCREAYKAIYRRITGL